MLTLSNDTWASLPNGASIVLANDVPANHEPSGSNVTGTRGAALLRYLGQAISEQGQQARALGFTLKRAGSIGAYCFSFYGLMTFFISLILNRTMAIASSASAARPNLASRNPVFALMRRMPLSQETVLKLLRLLVVVLLFEEVIKVLMVLRIMAQNYDPSSVSRLTRLVPAVFQYDPLVFPDDLYMQIPANEVRFGPTSDMLWPLYLSVAYLIFVETFASAICNKQPLQSAGITLFELSLAIQEMTVEYTFFGGSGAATHPTEQVLLVCLFALMEQVSNQIGAVLYANKYRLVPLSILSVCFLWYVVDILGTDNMLDLPAEIFVTYFCLLLIILITMVCLLIFVLALITKGSRLDELNYTSFFEPGHEDNEFLFKRLNLNWDQDFYTAVLNLGMIAVTLAGRSSYITECSVLTTPKDTWLEAGVWARLLKAFNPSVLADGSSDTQAAKVSAYLRENGISGYENMTTSPPMSIISGSDSRIVNKPVSSFYVRYTYMKEILNRFAQILVWPLVGIFHLLRVRHKPGSAQDLAKSNAKTPPFLRHLAKKPRQAGVDLNTVDIEELEENYAALLSGSDFLEADSSPDYVCEELDSGTETGGESDEELLDLTETTTTGYRANELVTPENLLELVQDREVLEKHLRHDKGPMTRSVFRTGGGSTTQDDWQKLLSLVVEKRRKEAEENEAGKRLDDDDNCLMDHLACVVCQTQPREIITWPCKCFSICEGCRLSLVAKGMEGCVCCRRDVEGVSRVFLP